MRRVLSDRQWRADARSRRWRFELVIGHFALLLLLPFAVGCGQREAKVSGQVLYKDKPVPGGTVMFRPLDEPGRSLATAELDEAGRYELTVAVGKAQILLDNRQLAPPSEKLPPLNLPANLKVHPGVKADGNVSGGGKKPGRQKPAGAYREIPSHYYQFETSGLEYTVKGEPQTHDIQLR